MKKLTALLLICIISIAAASAATEYTTTAFHTGFAANNEQTFAGFHMSYQFGADFTEDFNFGFGSTIDLEIPIANPDYDLGASFLLGPAFAVGTSSFCTQTTIIGLQVDALGKTDDDDMTEGGVGIGLSTGWVFYPPAEKNSRVGLGFTAGINAKLMMGTDGMPYTGASGFVGMTFFGDMFYYSPYSYYDPYELALDLIFDD